MSTKARVVQSVGGTINRVKAEAALSVLAFNIIRASNAFGTEALMSRG